MPLAPRALTAKDAAKLRAEYESRYERQFGLRISDVPVEFLTWSVNVSTGSVAVHRSKFPGKKTKAIASGKREVFEPNTGKSRPIPAYLRGELGPGARLAGPALIVEPQTTTLVPRGWRCEVAAAGHLILERMK